LFPVNTVEIQVPPLRERREDIPALAPIFRTRAALPQIGFRFEAAALQTAPGALLAGQRPRTDHAVERAGVVFDGRKATPQRPPTSAARRE